MHGNTPNKSRPPVGGLYGFEPAVRRGAKFSVPGVKNGLGDADVANAHPRKALPRLGGVRGGNAPWGVAL